MTAPSTLLSDASGVYARPADISALRARAARSHCRWQTVDLTGAHDKAGFLAACARDLGFPAHFGGNWDALADSIDELAAESAQGIVIDFTHVREFGRVAPDDAATALAILRDTADAWRARKRTFIVLLDEAPPSEMLAKFALPGA